MLIVVILAGIAILFCLVIISDQRRTLSNIRVDIHRNQLNSAELQRQLSTFELLRDAVLRAMDDAMLILDNRGIVRFANDAALELFQRESVGQTLMGATRHYELDNLAKSARQMPHEIQERRFVINDHVMQVRVLDIEKYAIIFFHDVTMIQQLSRARREMIANISHELNTPITTIGLIIDTLIGGAVEKPDVREKMLSNVRAEVETLSQLVQEMRDLSLIESRQMPIKLVPTELAPLIKDSVDPLFHLSNRKNQTIRYEIPADMIVYADENQVPRVLKNIVHNAIKFSPEDGEIVVIATQSEDEATIQVKDSGPGISQSDLPRIFERFFQADQSRQEGTGLGLAIARHIILGHGGSIWAENNPDGGASFFFTLPLERSAEDHPVT
ncbi:MAG: cell wall metabolism sensor histidine kinase WalK [Chloroflexi bacterium]|nr:cell wall metabolism sensor histidine kinase WalK [Chloroflexota bacterium]